MDIMYYVMDAHSFYNFIYFILLIIVSAGAEWDARGEGWGGRPRFATALSQIPSSSSVSRRRPVPGVQRDPACAPGAAPSWPLLALLGPCT